MFQYSAQENSGKYKDDVYGTSESNLKDVERSEQEEKTGGYKAQGHLL